MNREDDKQVLADGRPFIRSAVALLIYTFRRGGYVEVMDAVSSQPQSIEDAYVDADVFPKRLDEDLSK